MLKYYHLLTLQDAYKPLLLLQIDVIKLLVSCYINLVLAG